MQDSPDLAHPEPPVDALDSLGFEGRVWVDVDALVASLRTRARGLALAGDSDPDPVGRAVLHGRATELEGRADALALALLDEVGAARPVG